MFHCFILRIAMHWASYYRCRNVKVLATASPYKMLHHRWFFACSSARGAAWKPYFHIPNFLLLWYCSWIGWLVFVWFSKCDIRMCNSQCNCEMRFISLIICTVVQEFNGIVIIWPRQHKNKGEKNDDFTYGCISLLTINSMRNRTNILKIDKR